MADVTFSINEPTFTTIFNLAYPSVKLPFDGSNSFEPFWLGVNAEVHIEGAGGIDFEDGDTFLLKELDIGWDTLILRLGFDLPTVTIGRFCLIRIPRNAPFGAGECVLEFPGETLFADAPDIGPVKLNLNAIVPFVVTEISGRYRIGIKKDGAYQKLYAHVQAIDVDPISIDDTFGKLPLILKAGIAAAAAQVTAKVPQAWLLDAALGILGYPSVTEWLLDLLDISDDVEEWLMDKLNVGIGIDNLLYQVIFAEVLKKNEVFKIDDPYPFVEAATVSTDKFGGFTPPEPTATTFTIPETAAGIVNASATFDADNLWVRFDFAF